MPGQRPAPAFVCCQGCWSSDIDIGLFEDGHDVPAEFSRIEGLRPLEKVQSVSEIAK